jgi:LPXTG-site transpeptidase (sortase) family protein
MPDIIEKIKYHWKGIVSLIGLFLVIYFGLYSLSLVNTDGWGQPYTPYVARAEDQFNRRFGSSDATGMDSRQWAQHYKLTKDNAKPDDDPDGDGLPNKLEYKYGTSPVDADTDKDGFTDKQEISNGYDPDAPGDARPKLDLAIAKLAITAPVIWSASDDEKSLEEDLKNGVTHYPNTPAPGEPGNMVISGHSSNYVWAKGNYNHIFQDLNKLAKGDIITVTASQQNGRTLTYRYIITDKKIATPNDQSIFQETEKPTITLTTCWPIGSNSQRLIVKAELATN